MNKKRGRKPYKITPERLRESGYTYKIDILTEEEKGWMKDGVPVPGKPNQRTPCPDFWYWFKEVDGVGVQINFVKSDYYYQGVRLRSMSQLPLVEAKAKDSAKWDKLLSTIEDTPVLIIPEKDREEIERRKTDGGSYVLPVADGCISLQGGPLDGRCVQYNNKFPFFMTKIADENGGKPIAPRYKRSKENPSVYIFDQVF